MHKNNIFYPEYYRTVNIRYSKDAKTVKTARAWLAVNDDGKRIWTLDDNTTVLGDNEIIFWWY
jgi:hypothetical protein